MRGAYRIALICGAAPLLAAALLFVLWIATHWDGLMYAGVAVIYLGLILFIVGVVSLTRYGWLAARAPDVPRKKLGAAVGTALVLLGANFPVAWGIAGAVTAIETRYTVTVRNDSAQPITQVRIFGGGATAAIFSIPAHGATERSLWFLSPGQLRFEAMRDKAALAEVIDGHVVNGRGGRAQVVVNATGGIIIEHPTTRR